MASEVHCQAAFFPRCFPFLPEMFPTHRERRESEICIRARMQVVMSGIHQHSASIPSQSVSVKGIGAGDSGCSFSTL